ncbi:hypothetical protein FQR65_LT17542 [Abscondita terminalis]|nr:hypothetical protein FQR65_LT17542 [Abscondita terminalis]
MDLKRSITTGEKLRGADKLARIPVKIITTEQIPQKPEWIRAKISHPEEIQRIKDLLRQQKLHTVCEEAVCPNLPQYPDEPKHLAETVKNLNLKYVVITSVDRDDLKDGGAQHFVDCIKEIRQSSPDTLIEILVPDFRGRLDLALEILSETPPDVFNHNIETVPRLYRAMRPGSDYQHSLELLKKFKHLRPDIATKCGLMVGLGEVEAEVIVLLNDLSDHLVDYVTIGQYLQPSKSHAPIHRFVSLKEFEHYQTHGQLLGFKISGVHLCCVYSHENQMNSVQDWVCYAAPIVDPVSGQFHGIINLSTKYKKHTSLGVLAVERCAELVQRAIQFEQKNMLYLKVFGTPKVQFNQQLLTLTHRQIEILCILILHPDGINLDELHYALYGDRDISEKTLKAEMSQLRTLLPNCILSRPYKLICEIQTDFIRAENHSMLVF